MSQEERMKGTRRRGDGAREEVTRGRDWQGPLPQAFLKKVRWFWRGNKERNCLPKSGREYPLKKRCKVVSPINACQAT